MKQYMPMKTHEWGFKLFILAGVAGLPTNSKLTQDLKIIWLDQTVNQISAHYTSEKNYRPYHDNFYTAIPLMAHLANCKLPIEAKMKKEERGSSHEYMTTVDGVDITSLVWKDNKYVTLISSFAGTRPEALVKRYDRKQQKTIDVKCPYIIQQYNRHMGGVDLLDSL